MARTGLVYREEYLLHRTGPGHPERPSRLEAVLRALKKADLKLPFIPVKPASREDLLRVHTEAHIVTIEETCANNGKYPDPDTSMGRESWDAALLAAGGVIAAAKTVWDRDVDNVFCAVRPPGHHAERDRAVGFCLFNNVAIAARWLQQQAGVKRIAILDWDVHHGNGTQQAFFDDETVYYVSLHQHPLFPGTGFPHERGAGNTNLNIQMTPGNGHDQWIRAIDRQVVPELEQFGPDFLFISCGFDAHELDPLATQRLTTETFAEMTRKVRHLAQGRVVSVLEGGYHLVALGECAVAHIRALRGET